MNLSRSTTLPIKLDNRRYCAKHCHAEVKLKTMVHFSNPTTLGIDFQRIIQQGILTMRRNPSRVTDYSTSTRLDGYPAPWQEKFSKSRGKSVGELRLEPSRGLLLISRRDIYIAIANYDSSIGQASQGNDQRNSEINRTPTE